MNREEHWCLFWLFEAMCWKKLWASVGIKMKKEMATHSSVLAWRIPGMVEPGGLPSMGSHRVGHDWSDLAAAAAAAVGIKKSPRTLISMLSSARLVPHVCVAPKEALSWSWVSRVVLPALLSALSDQDGGNPWKKHLFSSDSSGLGHTPDQASLLLTFSNPCPPLVIMKTELSSLSQIIVQLPFSAWVFWRAFQLASLFTHIRAEVN